MTKRRKLFLKNKHSSKLITQPQDLGSSCFANLEYSSWYLLGKLPLLLPLCSTLRLSIRPALTTWLTAQPTTPTLALLIPLGGRDLFSPFCPHFHHFWHTVQFTHFLYLSFVLSPSHTLLECNYMCAGIFAALVAATSLLCLDSRCSETNTPFQQQAPRWYAITCLSCLNYCSYGECVSQARPQIRSYDPN